METVFGQALALRLEKWDEHCSLESDTTGLKMSRGTFTFTYDRPGDADQQQGKLKQCPIEQDTVKDKTPAQTCLLTFPVCFAAT